VFPNGCEDDRIIATAATRAPTNPAIRIGELAAAMLADVPHTAGRHLVRRPGSHAACTMTASHWSSALLNQSVVAET
jgi:hypothetical protein